MHVLQLFPPLLQQFWNVWNDYTHMYKPLVFGDEFLAQYLHLKSHTIFFILYVFIYLFINSLIHPFFIHAFMHDSILPYHNKPLSMSDKNKQTKC